MKKRTYYLFKEIIPNFLLPIFLILLFNILNFNVEITNSKYVLLFSLFFTLINLIVFSMMNLIQIGIFKRFTIKDILYDQKVKITKILISIKIITIALSIVVLYFTSIKYSGYIIFKYTYIPIIIGLTIEILKIILNIIFKFDKIITLNQTPNEMDQKIQEMINEMMENDDDDDDDEININKELLKKYEHKEPKAKNNDKNEKR